MSEETKKGATPCRLEDLTFPVELIDNPNRTNREYSKIVVGVIDDEEFDLNYCSPRYELVPNTNIFPKVENILNAHGIKFEAYYSHTNHARFYGSYIITDERFAYTMEGTNDKIRFIWNFQHSYNGLTKYKGVAGFYRLICSNGLTVPVKEMNEYNLIIQGKHTKSILNSLEQFSHILENVTNNFDEVCGAITEKYERLSKVIVKKTEDRVLEVLKANKIGIVDNVRGNTMNEILGRIEKESKTVGLGYNGKVNDWLVYNSINRYIHNDDFNIAPPEKRRETDTKVLNYMLNFAA